MKKTAVYTFTGVLSPILTLALLPVYLKFLAPIEYLVLALTNSFLVIFSIFFNLKTEQAYRTIFFYENENKTKQLALFRTIFHFNVICSLVWLVFFLFFGKNLFDVLFKNDIPFFPYSYLIFLSFLIGNLNNLFFIYLQNNSKVTAYGLFTIVLAFATHGLQLSCVFIFHTSFFGFLGAGLLVNVLVLAFILLKNSTLFHFSISKKLLMESLRFSWPFLPFLVLYSLESQMDRFFTERFLTLSELARYAVLVSIIGAINTFFNTVDNAIRPDLYSNLSDKKNSNLNKVQDQLDFYLWIGLVVFSFLIGFGFNIDWFLQNEKYVGLTTFFIPLILAFFPLIGIRFMALILIYKQKVSKLNNVLLIKIITMAGLFYLLIPIMGINGAILSIGISNLLNVLIFYFMIENKFLPSKKVMGFLIGFIVLNLFLLFNPQTKFVYFIASGQCIVLGSLFVHFYQKKLKTILH
jgi:O-antigen/teichoic acid export membrane protein